MAVITVKVNGKNYKKEVSDNTLLSDFLRENLSLTGTHVGCDTSQCGACVVHLNGNSVKSCTTLVADCNGSEITTIEGLGGNHKVQRAWMALDVPQCGYCQPGQIMQASALLANNKKPSDADIDSWMSGNICRCGTYPRIRAAIKAAAKMS